MSNLGQEKISHKVLRIICLCLVVVVIGAVIGFYFITKKSVSDTFNLYKDIVARNIEKYGEKSLFEKDRDIVALYTKSEGLELVVQDIVTDQEVEAALQDLNTKINGGNQDQITAAQKKYDDLKNQQHYNLLLTQYKQLLIYSNTYFDAFIQDLAKQNKSLTRAKMNNLYEKVEALEAKIESFQKDKLELEQKTNIGGGSTFEVSEANTLGVLKEHMQSYVELIKHYVEINKTFVSVHIELQGLTNALNDNNAKIILNYAIMYATSYFVINAYEKLAASEEYFVNYTTNDTTKDLFNKITELYNLSSNPNGVVATTDTITYSYLYNRTQNIYSELDNLKVCANKMKDATQNGTLSDLNPIYEQTLNSGKQNVLTFLDGVKKVVVQKTATNP